MAAHMILIVDDDPLVRGTVRQLLERLGYDVAEAGTCAEALAFAEALQPDLILLDLRLPDGDGIDAAQELRRRPTTTSIPIAIFSGEPLFGRRAEIAANLCAGTIPKPATHDRLERDIRLLLAIRRARARRFPRVPVEAPVWWRVRGADMAAGAEYAAGVARTLSVGGLMMELDVPIAAESLLDLRLSMWAREVAAAGKVVWSRSRRKDMPGKDSYQHGIEFVGMAPDQRAEIQHLVQAAGAAPA